MLKALFFVVCVLVGNSVIAHENATHQRDGRSYFVLVEKKLKYGDLKIVEYEECCDRDVLFDSKSIFTNAQLDGQQDDEMSFYDFLYYIENVYYINDKEVVLVRQSAGGKGTIDGFFFLTLSGGSSPIVSKVFAPDNFYPVRVNQLSDKIIVDLGYNSKGQIERAVYQAGIVDVIKLKVKKKIADEKNCRFLYDGIYKPFAKSQECDEEPSMVGGVDTSRFYVTLNDPNIDYNTFERLSKKACRLDGNNLLIYADFKKKVCIRK